jgi:hypothetical protein
MPAEWRQHQSALFHSIVIASALHQTGLTHDSAGVRQLTPCTYACCQQVCCVLPPLADHQLQGCIWEAHAHRLLQRQAGTSTAKQMSNASRFERLKRLADQWQNKKSCRT